MRKGREKMREKVSIPQKLLLTVDEAAEYSNIGQQRIRELFHEPDCDFLLRKGTVTLIKRTKFEQYLMKKEVL